MSDQGNLPDPTAAEPVVDAGAADEAAMGAVFDRLVTNNGADRGDDGKFVSPTGEGQGTAGEPGAGDPPPDSGAPPAVTSAPVVTPPSERLLQPIKENWDKIPEPARKAIVAHQDDMDRKFSVQGRELSNIKPFADELSRAMQTIPECAGMSPTEMAQAAVRLAAIQSDLNKDPLNTFLEIAKRYEILPQLAQAFQEAQKGATPADSNQIVAGLERKIANLEAQVKGVKPTTPEDIRKEIDNTMTKAEAEKAFAAFASDEKHKEHLEAILDDLPYFVDKVLKTKGQGRPYGDILTDAYDMACNANPDVRAKVRAAEAAASAATNGNPTQAEAARKAVSINVKAASNGKDRVLTEDEALGLAFDRSMAAH